MVLPTGAAGSATASAADGAALAYGRERFRLWYTARGPDGVAIHTRESGAPDAWDSGDAPAFGERAGRPAGRLQDPYGLYHQRLWYLWYTVAAPGPAGVLDRLSRAWATVAGRAPRARSGPARIFGATAADGRTWLGHAEALAPGPDFDRVAVAEPCVVRDPEANLWRMAYAAFDGAAWRIGLAESVDLLHWTRVGMILEPWEQDITGCRTPRLVRVGASWLMVVTVLMGAQSRVFCTTSPDLVWWSTPTPFAAADDAEDVEATRAGFPLIVGPDLYLFYGCLQAGRWHTRGAVARRVLEATASSPAA